MLAEALPHHPLDQDRHALVVVDQILLLAVDHRVGGEQAGVDLLDRAGQGLEVGGGGALVGAEEAVILAGEGDAEVVLQQGGGAHDQRRVAHLLQDQAQPVAEGLGDATHHVLAQDPRVLLLDLLVGHVLEVDRVTEVVGLEELIEHVAAQEVGVGHPHHISEVDGVVLVGAVEDRLGQHHPPGLAADLAPADAAPVDRLEVTGREVVLGDLDEGELVAEHPLGQHDDDLSQVVPQGVPLLRGGGLDLLGLGEEHLPGGDLRVEREEDAIAGRRPLVRQHLLHDAHEVGVREVQREVKLGQGRLDPREALLPVVLALLGQRIVEALPPLRLDRLVADLVLQRTDVDDAAVVEFLAHPTTDDVAEDRVLQQLKVDRQDLGAGPDGEGLEAFV